MVYSRIYLPNAEPSRRAIAQRYPQGATHPDPHSPPPTAYHDWIEPLAAAAIAGLTGIITDVIKSRGGKLLDQLDRDILKPDDLKKALRQYVQNYQERHGKLKVACVRMDNPMKLDELYTAVQLLDRSELRYFESADALQDWFRGSNRRGFGYRDERKREGVAVANQVQYLMVLGGPGVGKSTFLRKVGLEALKSKQGTFQHDRIPVFLALQQFRSKEITVTQLIAKEFEIAGFPEPEEFAQGALDKGKLLILLDGLDEVPTDHLDHAINQIRNLVDRHSQNRFIASCRIAAYKGGFTRFSDVAMAPFDDEQIEQFIRNWFRSIKDQEAQTADQCWQLLQQPEYQAAKELAQTPLLLTLLCAVYDKSLSFPKNRAALYGEALDVLLKEWAAEKRLHRDPIYQELSIELERELLADIAYESFESDQLFFNKREVTNRIKAFLVNNLNAPKHLDSEKVLEAIEVQQGILVERARNAYSFSHLTFQEYLTAQYIVDNQQIEQTVAAHLIDERWQEVFLLIAGLAPGRRGADDLLLLMEKQAQTYIELPQIKSLLDWSSKITDKSNSKYSATAKKLASIFLVRYINRTYYQDCRSIKIIFSTISPSLTNVFSLDQYDYCEGIYPTLFDFGDLSEFSISASLSFAEEQRKLGIFIADFPNLITNLEHLERELPNHKKQNIEHTFKDKIREVWLDALQLSSDLRTLAENETKALSNYFYIYALIIQCKNTAIRLSSEVWAGIEERMLTVRMGDEGSDRSS